MTSAPFVKPSKRRAFFWVGGQLGLSQVIRLAANLVLARLVAPEVFALSSLALTLYSGLVMITDVGLYGSILKEKEEDTRFLHTAWSVQILRGLLVWFASLALALAIAGSPTLWAQGSTLSDPRLPAVLAATSFAVVIDGFRSINMLSAYRHFNPGPVVRSEVLAQLGGALTMLGLASVNFGIWAVVAGNLASSFLLLTFSFWFVPGPSMAWRLDREAVRRLLSFGKWVFLSSVLTFLGRQADKLVFGAFLVATMFGTYTIASAWIMTAILVLRTVARRVVQPAFAELNREQNQSELVLFYRRARLGMDAICGILFLCVVYLADPIFDLLYDKRYDQIGYFMPLLGFMLLSEPYRLLHIFLLAEGRSKAQFIANFFQIVAVAAVFMFLLEPEHPEMAILGFALSSFASLPVLWWLVLKSHIMGIWSESRMVLLLLAAFFLLDFGV